MINLVVKVVFITLYLSALDFWYSLAWNFEFDELDFFPCLNWIFTACVACKNPVQTRKKNHVHQTWNFKLNNVKNQVQIDRVTVWKRKDCNLYTYVLTIMHSVTDKEKYEWKPDLIHTNNIKNDFKVNQRDCVWIHLFLYDWINLKKNESQAIPCFLVSRKLTWIF